MYTKHQQVLFQLQQLRGRLILRPSDIGMMDEELEGLRLSVEKSDLIDSDEVDQICQLLSSFRMAMLSDLRQ
jgi:hypothetical protein